VTIDLEETVAIYFHTHAEVGRAGEDGYLTGAGGPGRRGSSTVSPSEREASAPWQKFMTSGRRRRGYRARSRLSSFGSARDKVVCGTSLDPATLDKLKVERPGSRARKIPDSLLAEHRDSTGWRPRPALESEEPSPEPAIVTQS
jgi:hypothetical protein